MATTTVEMRCPACGGALRVVLAPAPPTQWFPCPHCRAPVPVVVPRDPPPLYSWEVLPGLYPVLAPPAPPRRRPYRAAAAALVVVAVVAAGFVGVLAFDAYVAAEPASFAVDGTVGQYVGNVFEPIAGATVALTNDANATSRVVTGLSGTFAFDAVPTGGVSLNVSAAGFAPTTVLTFVSAVYSGPATGLLVALAPGTEANGTTNALSPFPDLEQFEASIGSGAVLLAVIVLVAGVAAVATVRDGRPALGVVGGAAGAVAPLVMFYLALSVAFPVLTLLSAIAAGAGTFAAAVRVARIAQTGPAAD
jgi:hypothetical protein